MTSKPTGRTKRAAPSAERRANRPALIDPNQFYSVEEAAAAFDKCRVAVYREIASGTLRAVKEGSRTKILGAEIIRANLAARPDAREEIIRAKQERAARASHDVA